VQLGRLRQSPPGIQIPRRSHCGGHDADGFVLLFDVVFHVLHASREIPGARLLRPRVEVAEHEDTAALGALGLLDELAGAHVAPEGGPERGLRVCFVVHAHDLLDVLRGLAGVVEGNGGNEVVADVGADDVVEEVSVDEAEITVDGGGCAAGKGPGLVVIVGHASIGVLKEGYCNFAFEICQYPPPMRIGENSPIQLLTQSQGTPQSTMTVQLPKTCPAQTSAAIIVATPTSLKRIRWSSFFL
jgi:hypothetical protein